MGNAQEIPSFNATNAQKVEVLLDILSTKKAEFEEGMTEYALISQLKSPPYQSVSYTHLTLPTSDLV